MYVYIISYNNIDSDNCNTPSTIIIIVMAERNGKATRSIGDQVVCSRGVEYEVAYERLYHMGWALLSKHA